MPNVFRLAHFNGKNYFRIHGIARQFSTVKKTKLLNNGPSKSDQSTIIFKSVGTLEEISHFLHIIHSPAPPSQCYDPRSITYYALKC